MKSMTLYIASHFTHMKMHPESICSMDPKSLTFKKKKITLHHHNVYA